MRDKTVRNAMTPLESVFMLDINDTLGNVTMDKVKWVWHEWVWFLTTACCLPIDQSGGLFPCSCVPGYKRQYNRNTVSEETDKVRP